MSSSPVHPKAYLLVSGSAQVAPFLLKAMQSCDGHMSLYQLTVEQGTPLARDVEQGTVVRMCPATHTHRPTRSALHYMKK